MFTQRSLRFLVVAAAPLLLAARVASAQGGAEQPPAVPPEYAAPEGPAAEVGAVQDAPVPPNVEQAPVATSDGSYCYVGPHPVDMRYDPSGSWDAAQGPHSHPYPPLDQRLFAFRDGCYYFVGDPNDFGYQGQSYAYYGAHPVLDAYGGGWCFMIGGHSHFWQPWSPYFVTVGPWFYWQGPYDPFFWSYWPYYSFYYRTYYPRYYAGGRFYRGGRLVAPPVGRVARPAAAQNGMATGARRWGTAPGRTVAPGAGSWRAPAAPASAAGLHAGWGAPAAAAPGAHAGWGPSVPNASPVRPGPAAPTFRSPGYGGPPAGSFHSAPSGGGFRSGGGGGGARSGGGGGHHR